MNTKTDYKKELAAFYKCKQNPVLVDVPEMTFLMVDGINAEPDSHDFQNGIKALFSVSYKVKFISKNSLNKDYTVMPLEGLWWADDMNDFKTGYKKNWKWTLMIFQPNYISKEIIYEVIDIQQKKEANEALNLLRLEKFTEGPSAQILHVGPFSEEEQNINKIHQLIWNNKNTFDGQIQKHHEIYLSDFRRTAPEKLRTIIRQPYQV